MEKMTQEQAPSVLILWYTNSSVKDMEGKKARTQPCKGPETAISSTNGYRARRSPVRMTRLTGLQEVGMKKRRLNFIPITIFLQAIIVPHLK
jgi:hypothetical protein